MRPGTWAQEHRRELIDVYGGSGSDWVAHMRAPDGRYELVKAASSRVRASWGEPDAWRAWAGVPGVPALLDWDPETGISVREWVEGETVNDSRAIAVEAGQLLARLHVPVDEAIQPLTDWTRSVRRRFQATDPPSGPVALDHLALADGSGERMLHGDYRLSNLVMSPSGLSVIDPYGYRGDPSFDLATFVITAYGCDRQEIARMILDGYGSVPQTFGSTTVWFGITHAGFLRSIGRPDPSLETWVDRRVEENEPHRWFVSP